MVGPLLIVPRGKPEQHAKFSPRILSGDDCESQGNSEPGSGSDLGSLSWAAVADGADCVINGGTIWATLARRSNRMFMLLRISWKARKQRGMTFLL